TESQLTVITQLVSGWTLRDEGEGEFEYKIRFPAMTAVSNEWIAAFEVDANVSTHIEKMQLNNGNMSVKGMSLKGSAHNCWVFCVSMSDRAAGNVSKAHVNKWKIPEDKIQEFGNFLAMLLWNSISFGDLPHHLVEKYSLQEISAGLGLEAEMKPVTYTGREIHIGSEKDFPVEKIRDLKANIAFIKPMNFSEEQEFRFAFWLTFRKQKVSINDNPKILQLRPIDQFVQKN
ncbi:MAG: hypothetical protein ACI8R4_001934, partial [Paracoccaceae bacterium]